MHIYQDADTSKEKTLTHLFCYPFMETKQNCPTLSKKRVEKETRLMIMVALINMRIKIEDIWWQTYIPEFLVHDHSLKIFLNL